MRLMEGMVNETGRGWYYRLLPSRRIRWMNAFGQIHQPLITIHLASYHSSENILFQKVFKNMIDECYCSDISATNLNVLSQSPFSMWSLDWNFSRIMFAQDYETPHEKLHFLSFHCFAGAISFSVWLGIPNLIQDLFDIFLGISLLKAIQILL